MAPEAKPGARPEPPRKPPHDETGVWVPIGDIPTEGGGDGATVVRTPVGDGGIPPTLISKGLAEEGDQHGPEGPNGIATEAAQPPTIDARALETLAIDSSSNVAPQVGAVDLTLNFDEKQYRDSRARHDETRAFYTDETDVGEEASRHSATVAKVGPYSILGELGRGGMGVVYKARHEKLRRIDALKMIRGGAHVTRDEMARFIVEARSVAKLEHPAIVRIYSIDEHEGLPYFSLEYVPEGTLSQKISKEILDAKSSAEIVAKLADGIDFAHKNGVLHRDIKPSNVLMASGNQPKLADFGLAKLVGDDASLRTSEGSIVGTPSYMAPEQARGQLSEIGPRSDQYSLGALLYHVLTGRPPFLASKPIETVLQVLSEDPAPPSLLQPNIPRDLETICLKTLSKEPTKRYESCEALAADLRRFLSGEPIQARPIGAAERMYRWCKRHPRTAIPIGLAIGSVLLALTVSTWSAFALGKKNLEIEKEKGAAIASRNLAYGLAVDAKDDVAGIVDIVANEFPKNDDKLREIRKKLIVTLLNRLEKLPDAPGDVVLATGREKSRVLEIQYSAAIDIGDFARAAPLLDEAERIYRERNQAQGATDASRFSLSTILLRKASTYYAFNRDMALVSDIDREAVKLLEEVLAHPNPQPFDAERGSIPQIQTMTALFEAGYQQALNLRRLGRVAEGLKVIERTTSRFDEAMDILRHMEDQPFKNMSEQEWEKQKRAFRGMLAVQDQLHATLLWANGRTSEATGIQNDLLARARLAVEEGRKTNELDDSPSEKLAWTLFFAGDIACGSGDREQGLQNHEEALTLTRKLYENEPKLENRRNQFNLTLMRVGSAIRDKDRERSDALYKEAALIAEEMLKVDSTAVSKSISLAFALPYAGEPERAIQIATDILSSMWKPDAEICVDLARVYACCATIARENGDSQQIEAHLKKALELLDLAVSQGYQDKPFLDFHPDLKIVRESPRYNDLFSISER